MKRIALVPILVLLLSGVLWTQNSATLVILHTNDIHAQILPRDGVGGLAELSTLIKRQRGDLILDGGDIFTGSMLCDEFEGKPIIEILNKLNYRAIAFGNHEFDYGIPAFRARAREAKFPILSANIGPNFDEIKPYTIMTVNGLRVAVIGLTTENVMQDGHPANFKNVQVVKLADALSQVLPKVRPLSDVIVAVAHVSQNEQTSIAKAFPEIRLIISGHPHSTFATSIGTTLIVQAGSRSENLGKVTMRFNGKTVESMTSEMFPVRGVEPDPEIKAIIEPYARTIATRAAERLGEAEAELRSSSNQESALNNLLADAFRAHAKTQIALENTGGIRSHLRKGPITYADLFEVLPFKNTLVTMTLTGVQVKQVLGRRVSAISGLKVEWDLTKPTGQRLVSATLADGSPIRDGDRYTVATNDFVAAGGDGFVEFLQGGNTADTSINLRDVLRSYFKDHPTVSAKLDGRVTVRR